MLCVYVIKTSQKSSVLPQSVILPVVHKKRTFRNNHCKHQPYDPFKRRVHVHLLVREELELMFTFDRTSVERRGEKQQIMKSR